MRKPVVTVTIFVLAMTCLPLNFAQSQTLGVFPEQRDIQVRCPEQLCPAPVPLVEIPFTVAEPTDTREPRLISLDEAIQIAIANADVIRVLTGISAASSGRTIYDVAITNTEIDFQTAVFDPTFDARLNWNKNDAPRSLFTTDAVSSNVSLSKRMLNGGTVGLDANSIGSYFGPGAFPLDPEYRSFVELALRQPLMRGYGRAPNLAPVVVARINTERSYFQFKDSVQELVRGVIAAYWNLVAARVNVWARQQQIEQAEFAFERAIARKEQGLDRAADVAQSRSALANFRASLLTARADLLLTETALRNIMGIEPSSAEVLVPSSLPLLEQVEFDWNEMVALAEQYRPDIIERKLILEADQITQIQVNNLARPQFDGIANYRWDGFDGELPNGALLGNQAGAGFNVGVNFSVPLGLRQSRASFRRQELLIAQDQVNLEQSIFQMVQQLTINYRNLDQFFAQYKAFQEVRAAARLNFENQVGEVRAGRREFLNALQAITDWGNAVSQEASSITRYNTELANVERQTGTILETHGIRFVEERYGSLGPRGVFGVRRTSECYPKSLVPNGGSERYTESETNSDEAFDLKALEIERDSSVPGNLNLQTPLPNSARPPAGLESGVPRLNALPQPNSQRQPATESQGPTTLNRFSKRMAKLLGQPASKESDERVTYQRGGLRSRTIAEPRIVVREQTEGRIQNPPNRIVHEPGTAGPIVVQPTQRRVGSPLDFVVQPKAKPRIAEKKKQLFDWTR